MPAIVLSRGTLLVTAPLWHLVFRAFRDTHTRARHLAGNIMQWLEKRIQIRNP